MEERDFWSNVGLILFFFMVVPMALMWGAMLTSAIDTMGIIDFPPTDTTIGRVVIVLSAIILISLFIFAAWFHDFVYDRWRLRRYATQGDEHSDD